MTARPRFSDDQIAAWGPFRNEWLAVALCDQRADRDTAEAAIWELCDSLGFPFREIVWCTSPAAGAALHAEQNEQGTSGGAVPALLGAPQVRLASGDAAPGPSALKRHRVATFRNRVQREIEVQSRSRWFNPGAHDLWRLTPDAIRELRAATARGSARGLGGPARRGAHREVTTTAWPPEGALRDLLRDFLPLHEVAGSTGDDLWSGGSARRRIEERSFADERAEMASWLAHLTRQDAQENLAARAQAELARRFSGVAGQHEAHWIAQCRFAEAHLGIEFDYSVRKRLNILEALCRSCGWVFLSGERVIACERPRAFSVNALGRLHGDGGPALAFADGTTFWMLNGVNVPREIAEKSAADLNGRMISTIENVEVRREFVRKLGIQRMLEDLQLRPVAKEGDYELFNLDLGPRVTTGVLKMRNPSVPDVCHFEFVAPECLTIQESLNFRNGLARRTIDDVNGAPWYQQGDVIIRPRGASKYQSRPTRLT